MQLTFHGAAGEVTGSATLLQTRRATVLIDFGLHQGGVEAEVRNRRFALRRIIESARGLDAVVLTHAHIDHCGRLPLLDRWGYTGPIFATPPTCDLVPIMLRDSASVQQSDAQRASRRRERQGKPTVNPLYDAASVEKILPQLVAVPYLQEQEIAPGITLRFYDAGHILGSASVELRVREGESERIVVFSGDIGPHGTPMLRDAVPPPHADVVVLESTYGDRDHRSREDTRTEFVTLLREAMWENQKVLIPAFAVGRTQNLLFEIAQMMRSELVPRFPVYVDSPMATSVTALYRRHHDLFDEQARALIDQGDGVMDFPDLHFTRSPEESRKLNDLWCCAVIIAASGMCTGGRILHHLRHNLWRHGTQVVIVGYQAKGSLGRRLVEGAKRVTIFGEPIIVRSRIHTLGGLSAHAGQSELIQWAGAYRNQQPRVFLNHGEDNPRAALAAALRQRFGYHVELPAHASTHSI